MAERTTTPPPATGLAEATAYATAIRSDRPLATIAPLPLPLAPDEVATLRTIATYERRYPVGPVTRWGDRQGTALIGTSRRLLVNHRFRGWLSFWLADLDTFGPVVGRHWAQVDLTWCNAEPPMRLSGPAAATIAVHVAAHTDPTGWTTLPALQSVLHPPQPRHLER